MSFREALYLVIGLLYVEKRVTYRRLQREFELDPEILEDVRDELIVAQRLAVDEEGEVLVWTGGPAPTGETPLRERRHAPETSESATAKRKAQTPAAAEPRGRADEAPSPRAKEAERRQLTVMFCDLVGSTALSGRLDPEDLRDVISAFQETCREAIHRYEGFVARYMGDGMLVYFGYPQAHEQDAERAVRAGLDILAAVPALNADVGARHGADVAVRIGAATGPVVVGDIVGEGAAEEAAVLGETPNLAARLQSIGEPNQLIVSGGTRRLMGKHFDLEDLGRHELKGMAEAVHVWRVLGVREAGARMERTHHAHAMPLVGRQEELGLLNRAWEASKDGHGQVVLIQGEAGIGKSRLVEALREQIASESYTGVVVRCSPYHTNSSLYPVIEHVKRAVGWKAEDDAEKKLAKLEKALRRQSLPLDEVVPLFGDLLSLPLPRDRYRAPGLEPKKKREATLDALVGWLLDEAEQKPVLQVFEDLHWADPTTLEIVGLYIEQSPTVAMLSVLTYRPEFPPPWSMRSHMTPITLNRLERPEVERLIGHQANGKTVPAEVVEHIVSKADGVPLYVEELAKTILESDYLREEADRYALRGALTELSIPATLQDSLMARLDRLPTVREVAQLGAVIGREFAYEMLRFLAPLEEPVLRNGLGQLVENELLYQRGRPPRSRYIFKHALLHDAAYQSLLRRTRQQYHLRVAELLRERFPETVEANPEMLAHHYTEAGELEAAVDFWFKAGERAREQSANLEAIAHLGSGLAMLQKLPESEERDRKELEFQIALGSAFVVTRGHSTVEAGAAFTRARELCERLGNVPEILLALLGLWRFNVARSALDDASDVARQLLGLAAETDDTVPFVVAHYTTGFTAFSKGRLVEGRDYLEKGIARYSPSQRSADAYRAAQDPGVGCRSFASALEWVSGFPDKARRLSLDSIALAKEIEDPFSLSFARAIAAMVYEMRGEDAESKENARGAVELSAQRGFSLWMAFGQISRDWISFKEHRDAETLETLLESVLALSALNVGAFVPYLKSRLALAYQQAGRIEEALHVVDDATAMVEERGECWWEAEIHRLKGEFLLSKSADNAAAARDCFSKALEVARHQQAKSLELRAAMSLGSLHHGKGESARAAELLRPVYDSFSEGYSTTDLAQARGLLEAWGVGDSLAV